MTLSLCKSPVPQRPPWESCWQLAVTYRSNGINDSDTESGECESQMGEWNLEISSALWGRHLYLFLKVHVSRLIRFFTERLKMLSQLGVENDAVVRTLVGGTCGSGKQTRWDWKRNTGQSQVVAAASTGLWVLVRTELTDSEGRDCGCECQGQHLAHGTGNDSLGRLLVLSPWLGIGLWTQWASVCSMGVSELQGRRRLMEWGQRESRADKVSATADRLDLPLFTGAGPRLQGVETRPQEDPATCQ